MLEWQPLTWHLFHTMALNYNKDYQSEYIKFFHSIKFIIPCKVCKEHFIKNITSKPEMYIENNINEDKFFNWTIDLHNSVNKMNHLSQWSYQQAKEYYTIHNFNDQVFKSFILEYVKHNFKKNPIKTNELINMLKTLAYFHPNEEIRNKLIDFTLKFELNRQTLKQWLISFLIILKNKHNKN